ncbi:MULTISPECIES: hypothetical protein [Metabacillus]|uniref:Uncharacterized protein n=1 Tax=Metabacillus hrfriensis TaxID=3048891 RepID=A0ACD4RHD9_9BACI|nr:MULTISPECIES: hypothetical protein [Metabacillus]UAL54362.1 hypothetical protein K8L98_11560 [Metabacillus dongyingensis]UOK59613.1 hypothetical protein MGI18_13255 [Bacillus sp. OVS6]USK30680.1 hypothetical protein LIT32_11460 [Bacillus sp. CMF21]WHZ59930.1 hypothetical protein QLQ22_11585 [Metabacillus sp. CT-WN-B3]
MIRKSVLVIGAVAVLTLSIGIKKDLENPKALANVYPFSENDYKGQVYVEDEDKIRVVSVEEQEMREKDSYKVKDITTVITADEQTMVENTSISAGFVSQKEGTGFNFKKEN